MILQGHPTRLETLINGNFGARDVINKIITEKFEQAPKWLAMTQASTFIDILYHLPVRGTEIYVLYNDKCDRDLEKFLLLLSVTRWGYFDRSRLKDLAADQMNEIKIPNQLWLHLINIANRYVKYGHPHPDDDPSPHPLINPSIDQISHPVCLLTSDPFATRQDLERYDLIEHSPNRWKARLKDGREFHIIPARADRDTQYIRGTMYSEVIEEFYPNIECVRLANLRLIPAGDQA